MRGNVDFMADGPQKAPASWIPLVMDKQNKWSMVVGTEAGEGFANSEHEQGGHPVQRTG